MFLIRKSPSGERRGGALALAVGCFAAGVAAGALIGPIGATPTPDKPLPSEMRRVPPPATAALRSGHQAQVVRVIDGDTFEARVNVWPGVEVTTRVRLRSIDTPEIHARCDDERRKAQAAREALTQILNEGSVGLSRISQDKYAGRVDADVSTAHTSDVSTALIESGHARRYAGGRREGWCG